MTRKVDKSKSEENKTKYSKTEKKRKKEERYGRKSSRSQICQEDHLAPAC